MPSTCPTHAVDSRCTSWRRQSAVHTELDTYLIRCLPGVILSALLPIVFLLLLWLVVMVVIIIVIILTILALNLEGEGASKRVNELAAEWELHLNM